MPARDPAARLYRFGNGRADGGLAMRERLGGKGAALADLSKAGLPVPPGFTIPTDACRAYQSLGRLPDGLLEAVWREIKALEKITGRRFGDPAAPLLLAVRSGAAVSMPGMMETVLNVGLNDAVAAAVAAGGRGRFACDSYRRLIAMFAVAVDGLPRHPFDDAMREARLAAGLADERELDGDALRGVADRSLAHYAAAAGRPFPQDPPAQLAAAIEAVFKSWQSARARDYRAIQSIDAAAGTAVTVQAMVFGNTDATSCTGVGFTRDPATGRKTFVGEFVIQAQGEDLVSGSHTPLDCKKWFPRWNRALWAKLRGLAAALEARYREVQDFEFTVERGELYLLQTRDAQRTAAAAVKIAVDLANEGVIDRRTAVARVGAATIARLRTTAFDPKRTPEPLTRGIAASPGAAVGRCAFTAAEAQARAAAGEAVILVRPETDPADVAGVHAARGVLTSTGGMTSHAALVARGFDTPCVVGAAAMAIDEAARTLTIKTGRRPRTFGPGDFLSIDGTTGDVFAGDVPTIVSRPSAALRTLLGWRQDQRGRK